MPIIDPFQKPAVGRSALAGTFLGDLLFEIGKTCRPGRAVSGVIFRSKGWKVTSELGEGSLIVRHDIPAPEKRKELAGRRQNIFSISFAQRCSEFENGDDRVLRTIRNMRTKRVHNGRKARKAKVEVQLAGKKA